MKRGGGKKHKTQKHAKRCKKMQKDAKKVDI